MPQDAVQLSAAACAQSPLSGHSSACGSQHCGAEAGVSTAHPARTLAETPVYAATQLPAIDDSHECPQHASLPPEHTTAACNDGSAQDSQAAAESDCTGSRSEHWQSDHMQDALAAVLAAAHAGAGMEQAAAHIASAPACTECDTHPAASSGPVRGSHQRVSATLPAQEDSSAALLASLGLQERAFPVAHAGSKKCQGIAEGSGHSASEARAAQLDTGCAAGHESRRKGDSTSACSSRQLAMPSASQVRDTDDQPQTDYCPTQSAVQLAPEQSWDLDAASAAPSNAPRAREAISPASAVKCGTWQQSSVGASTLTDCSGQCSSLQRDLLAAAGVLYVLHSGAHGPVHVKQWTASDFRMLFSDSVLCNEHGRCPVRTLIVPLHAHMRPFIISGCR